ncbi:MAG: hypothetical protein GWN62_21130 [Aliifodinibius sp.]|nr:hypothetical protein [Fodinibius sp.]
MNSIPEYSKDVKNHNNYRITIGSEAFSAKNSTVLGAEDFNLNRMSDKMDSEKSSKKSILLWSFGTNLSSFINEEGTWQLGYSLGLTFDFRVFKNLSITLPFSYTRINAAPENVEGRTFPNIGENIYKTLNDWQVSVGFLEFPILFTYKFFSKNSYDIRYILGPGLVIATKDFSKIENITKTDEIIGVEKYGPPLEPQHELYSGYNIITGIRFHVSRFYISVLYALYPYKIKSINKLNSISFRLGIDIH